MAQDPRSGDKIRLKVMGRLFPLILVAFAITACLAAAPPKKAKTASSLKAASAAQKSSKTPGSRHSGGNVHSSSGVKVRYVRNRHGKLVRVVGRTSGPSYQLHPDPERYQQIQQALADKGYFKGQVNGQWGNDSVDALKRFQTDQKIDNDGHLNSLTLIGLGLGPKHDRDVAAPGAISTPTSVPNNSAPKAGATTPLTPVANSTSTPGPPPPSPS